MDDKLENLNGFYFFEWGMNSEDIENIFKKNSIDYELDFNKIDIEFKFYNNDMDSYLYFDVESLYNIQQYKRFLQSERKLSDDFFDKTVTRLKNEFGQPKDQSENKERNLKEIIWVGPKTTIKLCYFYNSVEIQLHWYKTE